MRVPSIVPLPGPFSTLGYQAVEIADEKPARRRPPPQQRRPALVALPPVPRGYKVVPIDESRPPPRKPTLPAPVRQRPAPRRMSPLAHWLLLTVGGFVCAAVVITAIVAALPDRKPAEKPPDPLPPVVAVAPANPPAAAVAPANPPAPPPRDENIHLSPLVFCSREGNCGVEVEDNERQTFGTAVAFARNPQEAARAAARERKLLLVLHVSGNFEEARFT